MAATGRLLAKEGWATLFFDFFGTGDAPGDFADATWDRWQTDAETAFDLLRALSGLDRVAVLSARASAPLALSLAKHGGNRLSGLVFWEPVLDTAAWLRDARRRSHFRLGPARTGLSENDVDGYVYGGTLWNDMARAPSAGTPAPPPDVPVAVVALAPSGRPSAETVRLAQRWGARLLTANQAPFWLESDTVAGEALAESTRQALDALISP